MGDNLMKRRTKVGLLIAAFICGVSLWQVLKVDCGVGVDSVWWLPPDAHNITYISNWMTAAVAEFDIEQKAFEQWCASRKMPLREVGDGEWHMVRRPVATLENRGVIPASAEPNDQTRVVRGDSYVKVLNGGDLFYEERQPNGGGHTIGYDVEEKRGYYEYLHH
jgi:hypothetical protein